MEAVKESEAFIIMKQLLDAVIYCHSQGVVHFDIKVCAFHTISNIKSSTMLCMKTSQEK